MDAREKLIELRKFIESETEEVSSITLQLRRFRFQERHLLKRARKFRRWAVPLSRRLTEAARRARAAMDEKQP